MRGFTAARLIAAFVLFVALGNLPSAYYSLTKFVCSPVAAYGAYLAAERGHQRWMWAFGVTALLFTPFLPVRLDRSTWAVLDVIAAVLLLWSISNNSLVSDAERTTNRAAAVETAPDTAVDQTAPVRDEDTAERAKRETKQREERGERFRK